MLQYLEGKKVVCGNTYIMSPKGVGGYVYVHKVVFTVPRGGVLYFFFFFFVYIVFVYILIPMCYHTYAVGPMFPRF